MNTLKIKIILKNKIIIYYSFSKLKNLKFYWNYFILMNRVINNNMYINYTIYN